MDPGKKRKKILQNLNFILAKNYFYLYKAAGSIGSQFAIKLFSP